MAFKVRVLATELNGNLDKENRHRLERVMRLRPGDVFVITDGRGHEAEAILGPQGSYAAEKWSAPEREAAIELHLFAAMTKGEKFDWLVEKAVELGVRRIIPVMSRHCVVKKASESKLDRWQKIALSAMLQCGGCILPEIAAPTKLDDIPAPQNVCATVLYEYDAESKVHDLDQCRENRECWLLTGPEGGFAPEEINLLKQRGWHSLWLGPRIFRAETAPIIAVSTILAGSWGRAET